MSDKIDVSDAKQKIIAQVRSWRSLAAHYLERGNMEKYQHYLKLMSDATETVGDERALPVLSDPEQLSLLFARRQYPVLLQLAQRVEMTDFFARMLSAIHFRENAPEQAVLHAARISDPIERQLRLNTAQMWSSLHKPLGNEPRVHLLILTHNREDHVVNALSQFAQTDYRNYSVFIADNGSSDATWTRVLEGVKAFPGHIPVTLERFPTNIGRPAGHNWLLTRYDHAAADYIAIGDDDLVEVPTDWLTRMIQTAKVFPGCAAVGGKALNPGFIDIIHGGVRNILHFDVEELVMSNNEEEVDYGQYDYVDVVDHVIGCLHLYDRKILFDKIGLFDIRFSPCQFVDIDHHLRIRLAGYPIIFNGFVSFRHLRAMGNKAKNDYDLQGNSYGNIHKLLRKHERTPVMAILSQRRMERLDWLKLERISLQRRVE